MASFNQTERGPIQYRQTRFGFEGEDFELLKFRSTRVDAESGGEAVWFFGAGRAGETLVRPLFLARTRDKKRPGFALESGPLVFTIGRV